MSDHTAASYKCQIKACHQVIAEREAGIERLRTALMVAREYVVRVDGTMVFTAPENRLTHADLLLIDAALAETDPAMPSRKGDGGLDSELAAKQRDLGMHWMIDVVRKCGRPWSKRIVEHMEAVRKTLT